MDYTIVDNGRSSICPKCAGMLVRQIPDEYRCLDCRAEFQISGEGLSDREITVQQKEDG